MSFSDSFILEQKVFASRGISEIQQRIRPMLKCYSIREFKMNENNNFEFKTTYSKMICGKNIRTPFAKLHHAAYVKEDIDDKKCKIIVTFFD